MFLTFLMFPLIFKYVDYGHERAKEIFRLARDKEWCGKISIKIEKLCDDAGLVVERAF